MIAGRVVIDEGTSTKTVTANICDVEQVMNRHITEICTATANLRLVGTTVARDSGLEAMSTSAAAIAGNAQALGPDLPQALRAGMDAELPKSRHNKSKE